MRGGGLDRNAELIVRRDLGILPPEELERRCRLLGAELLPSNADFCARFDFAPRYPVWLKVWFADEGLWTRNFQRPDGCCWMRARRIT